MRFPKNFTTLLLTTDFLDTPEDVKKQRKNNGDNGFKRKADDDSGSDNSGDLMSWTPLQDIIDATPTLELKG